MDLEQSWMYKELMEDSEAAERCLADNAPTLDRLAELYAVARPAVAVLVARGTSLHAAVFAKYIFEEYIGLPTAIAEPSVVTKYNGKLCLTHSLVVGISQSGEGADICGIVDRGRSCGGLTVAITNNDASRLAQLGSVCLRCCAGKERSVPATKSLAAQLTLILAIAAKLSASTALAEVLQRCPEAFSAGINMQAEVRLSASCFKYMRNCVVLARGNSYFIAQEWALKLQEACSIRAHAFSVSNFLHGPIAMLDGTIPALLLAFDERTDDDMVQIIRRLRQLGTHILVVTNKTALAQEEGVTALLLPAWCDGLAGALAAVPVIQAFSCAFAFANGLNPDAPAGLNKVTITK